MTEENDFTKEDLEELEKIKKQRQQKPVDFKKNIKILLQALADIKTIDRYNAEEKNYKSDMHLFHDGGSQVMTNPTIVRCLAKAEVEFIKQNQYSVIKIAEQMLQADIDEIREMLK